MDLLKFALDRVISLFPVFIIIHLIVYVSGRKYVPEQSKLQRQETYLSYIHIPKSFPVKIFSFVLQILNPQNGLK